MSGMTFRRALSMAVAGALLVGGAILLPFFWLPIQSDEQHLWRFIGCVCGAMAAGVPLLVFGMIRIQDERP